jgi:hypothetical protein
MFYKKKATKIPVNEPVEKKEEEKDEKPVAYIKFFVKDDGLDVDYKYSHGMEEDFVRMLVLIQSPEIQEECLQNLPQSCVAKFHELKSISRPIIEPIYAFKGKNMNVRD